NLQPFTVTLTMRGMSSGRYNNNFISCNGDCPTTVPPGMNTIDSNYIAGSRYFDLSFKSELFDTGAEAFFVVENLLNADPALVAGSRGGGFYNGQGNARYYDRLGRYYRAGLRFRF